MACAKYGHLNVQGDGKDSFDSFSSSSSRSFDQRRTIKQCPISIGGGRDVRVSNFDLMVVTHRRMRREDKQEDVDEVQTTDTRPISSGGNVS